MLKIVTIRDGAKNTQGEEFTFFSVQRTFVTPERLFLDFTVACFLWETAMHAVQAKWRLADETMCIPEFTAQNFFPPQ